MTIFPAKHYLIAKDVTKRAVKSIRDELKQHLPKLNELEKQRLEMRTKYDLEMIEELGYCVNMYCYRRNKQGYHGSEIKYL